MRLRERASVGGRARAAAAEVDRNPNDIRDQNHGDNLQREYPPARHLDDRKH